MMIDFYLRDLVSRGGLWLRNTVFWDVVPYCLVEVY
jgi:hypothetical protein